MVGLFTFDRQFTSLTADREIPLSIRHQLIYSYSLDCAGVPWGSLTSLVVSLARVNAIHQWPVIKWFLPCSMSRTFIHMARFVLMDSGWRPLDRVITSMLHTLSQAAMEFYFEFCHIDWHCNGPWLCIIQVMEVWIHSVLVRGHIVAI